MPTAGTIVDEVAAELQGRRRSLRTSLAAAVTTGQTTVQVDSLVEVRTGDYLEVNDELVYAKAQTSHDDMTVDRAEGSSTAVAHSSGDRVTIQPRWWRHKILEKMLEEIQNLPRDVFSEDTVSVSMPADTVKVELTPTNSNVDVVRILDSRRDPTDSFSTVNRVPLTLLRDPDMIEFTSTGLGVQLADGWTYRRAETVWVVLGTTFDTSIAWNSDTELGTGGTGLGDPMVQAIKYGTIWRMQATAELARAQAQALGQSRRAEDIPPMYQAQVAVQFDVLRDKLIDDERARIVNKWGRRFRL